MKAPFIVWTFLLSIVFSLNMTSCQKAKKSAAAPSSSTNYSFKGQLTSVSVSSVQSILTKSGVVSVMTAKTITHVMAMSPETASPRRYIAEVGADGTFNLGVDAGRPYVVVYIASGQSLLGPDMIVGIFKMSSNDLDTLAPVDPGTADLGTVTVDGTAQQATISSTPADLLAALGLSSTEATLIGSIDDLSLRSANPDVDGNGIIDMLEDKSFYQDWHIRAVTQISGVDAKFSDATNQFLPTTTTVAFNLASGYSVYPATFFGGICPLNSGVDSTLTTGCSFDIKNLAGTASVLSSYPRNSMSGGGFSSQFQWGPDFNMALSQELPGSDGSAVRMVYGFPDGTTLTFWNVKTRTIASLTANGTILPFIRINTGDGTPTATVSSIAYQWMKLNSGTWQTASANEVELIVNENGANATFYTAKGSGVEEGFSFSVPRSSPTGTLTWDATNITARGSSAVLTTATPDSFCSSAVSYDDKLGLRIFAGGFVANTGVTACP